MNKVQKDVDKWIQQHKIKYWNPHEIMVRLMEEVGELAREINHVYGPKKKKKTEDKKDIQDEIGDIIFTLTCLANSLEIDLDETRSRTINKLYGRDNDRYEKS
jgi:NTP pyrophosphatase (non-canonical NTP hydrolase)